MMEQLSVNERTVLTNMVDEIQRALSPLGKMDRVDLRNDTHEAYGQYTFEGKTLVIKVKPLGGQWGG